MPPHHLYNERYPRVFSGHGLIRRLIAKAQFRAIVNAAPINLNDHILEVGCDEGVLLRMFERAGADVHGIDVNAHAVHLSRNSHISQGSAEAIPFPDSTFTMCVASHAIEHLEDPRPFFSEAARVLLSHGKLVLIYPWELFRGMDVVFDMVLHGRPITHIRKYHLHRYTPRLIRERAQGFPFKHLCSRLFWGFPHISPQYLTIFYRE